MIQYKRSRNQRITLKLENILGIPDLAHFGQKTGLAREGQKNEPRLYSRSTEHKELTHHCSCRNLYGDIT